MHDVCQPATMLATRCRRIQFSRSSRIPCARLPPSPPLAVLLIFDAGTAGPTAQSINSPTTASPGKVFATEGVTFLQCVDE